MRGTGIQDIHCISPEESLSFVKLRWEFTEARAAAGSRACAPAAPHATWARLHRASGAALDVARVWYPVGTRRGQARARQRCTIPG